MDVKTFIEERTKLEVEGFKFFFIFDMIYHPELKSSYGKKLIKFEERLDKPEDNPPDKMGNYIMCGYTRKNFCEVLKGVKLIHVGSEDGFSKEDIVFIGEESTDETSRLKGQKFVEAFKQIVSNKKMIPDKSCIMLNHEQCRILRSGSTKFVPRSTINMKKRVQLSQVNGQKMLTDYYKSTKATTSSSPLSIKKEPSENRLVNIRLMAEKLTQNLRGDKVKLLWLPTQHFELDPSRYVAIILLNEISLRLEAVDEPNVRKETEEAFNRLPNNVWTMAVNYSKDCEDYYLTKMKEGIIKSLEEDEDDDEEPQT